MTERRYRALLIGNAIFRRDPQGLPKLHGPRADVDALCEALADPQSGLFAPEDIEPLIDRNVQSLREELYRFFIEEATRDDVLFLYYSGHGKLDLQGRLHLCASDTRVGSLPVTALKYKEDIEALVKESPASSAVTVLDCCHSGAFRGGELKVKATGKGRCVITSASANELALDTTGPGGTSPFTSALVTGLRFAQAAGQLTAQGLYDYLETELSPAGNSRPQFFFDGEGAIPLARREPRALSGVPLDDGRFDLHELTAQFADKHPESERAVQSATSSAARSLADELDAGPVVAEPITWRLPEPRTHLWTLLNEAAASTLPENEQDVESTVALCQVVKAVARLDPKWPMAVVRRLAPGEVLQSLVEAMVAAIAEYDDGLALEYLNAFGTSEPEQIGARLAMIEALPEEKQDLGAILLQEAVDLSLKARSGLQSARLLVRIMQVLAEANADLSSNAHPRSKLHAAARKVAAPQRDLRGRFERALGDLVARETDPEKRASVLADVAVRLTQFHPGLAHGYFRADGRFLPQSAFEVVRAARIIAAATAMLPTDPKSTYRLLEIAERRCRTDEDWVELFETLMERLEDSPSPVPAVADHLVTTVERAIDRIPSDECRRLRQAAVSLVSTAPLVAGRLLRFDPDEDRMRAGLIEVAKKAAAVDAIAARHIADAAERLVLSILNEAEQADELVALAEAYAAIDPDHAVRLLRSVPEERNRRSMAITRVARVFAEAYPEGIEALIDQFASGERADSRMSDIYMGITAVDPARALQLAASMKDSPYKDAVIAKVAERMAYSAPEQASEIALGFADAFDRARALKAVVPIIASKDPDRAASLARKIPSESNCAYYRAIALSTASDSLAVNRPDQAEYLLSLAERAAERIEDEFVKGSALCDIARSYTAIGLTSLRASQVLAQAEQCASAETGIGDADRVDLLSRIMVAWASIAPRHAERVEAAMPEVWKHRDLRLREAAIAMAPLDPRRAAQFASSIGDDRDRQQVMAALVEEFCESAPARAEQLALAMAPGGGRSEALLKVAAALHRRRSGA